MAEELAELFINMIQTTIGGHESGAYKLLKGPMPKHAIPGITASFYNHVYESLANKTDCKDGCAAKMKAMQACTGHSPICLLNMLLVSTVSTHNSLDREKLDLDNYLAFMLSLSKEIASKSPDKTKLAEMLNHKCEGDQEVEPLPEGQKMFYVGEAPPKK